MSIPETTPHAHVDTSQQSLRDQQQPLFSAKSNRVPELYLGPIDGGYKYAIFSHTYAY